MYRSVVEEDGSGVREADPSEVRRIMSKVAASHDHSQLLFLVHNSSVLGGHRPQLRAALRFSEPRRRGAGPRPARHAGGEHEVCGGERL